MFLLKAFKSKPEPHREPLLQSSMGTCVLNGSQMDQKLKMHEQEIHMTHEVKQDLNASNKFITKYMKETDKEAQLTRKYLLLGSGSCGKSTLFRQLKCIYGSGFGEKEMKFTLMATRLNCVVAIILLLRKSLELSELDDETHAKCHIDLNRLPHLLPMIQLVLEHQHCRFQYTDHDDQDKETLLTLGEAISVLWNLPQVQQTYKRRQMFCIAANMDYFLNKVEDVFNPQYVSTHEDYIKSRITTTSIVDATYTDSSGTRFHVFDVGGQRNERQKWIHLFDGITSVIFVAALDHFCSMLFEDENKNALEESLDLFAELSNSKWFRRTHIILYLNKMDLFRERLKSGMSLRTFFNAESYNPKNPDYFAEYRGPDYIPTGNAIKDERLLNKVVDASTAFILDQFKRRNQSGERTLTIHKALSATDEQQVKRAFWDVLSQLTDTSETELFM